MKWSDSGRRLNPFTKEGKTEEEQVWEGKTQSLE